MKCQSPVWSVNQRLRLKHFARESNNGLMNKAPGLQSQDRAKGKPKGVKVGGMNVVVVVAQMSLISLPMLKVVEDSKQN